MQIVYWSIVLLCLCFVVPIKCQLSGDDGTLILVHTIFRHGDRNPDTLNLYPGNPFYNESNYAPFGYGQLTNAGKLKAYRVGTTLRERYNTFLDETYNIDLIEPRSSDFNRTKASLQAMLAGLFPPTKDLLWLEGLNWQPISFNYVERQYDKELYCYGCPNWDKSVDNYMKSKAGVNLLEKYKDTFKYISDNIGENITDILQRELNLPLPDWTIEVYPYPMKNITLDYYNIMFATERTRKLSGFLLKKIIRDIQEKINGLLPKKKMFIYSGHENNIAALLRAFDRNVDDIPPYGSYILIELHYFNDTYGVKVFYQDYSSDNPVPIKLSTCDEFCPFEKFVSLTSEFVPEDDHICGSASKGFKIGTLLNQYLPMILLINVLLIFTK